MAANGYIPASWLKPLPGSNVGLIKGYAYAYWRMHYHSLRIGGPSLAITDYSVGRTYRSYWRQVQAKRIYGRNAAWPGSSNHGWGRAVDVHTFAQRAMIQRIGAQYGWQKQWSDASWEWWHFRGAKTMGALSTGPLGPTKPRIPNGLTRKERAYVDKLLYHRREYKREAKTGKGPKYQKNYKWAQWWRERIEKQMRALAEDARTPNKGGWSKDNRDRRYKILQAAVSGKYG